MKRILIAVLAVIASVFCAFSVTELVKAEGAVSVSTAEEFLAMEKYGNYVLANDIVLPENEFYKTAFAGTFDGAGHSVEVNADIKGRAGLFYALGEEGNPATVKNLTIKGLITGTSHTGGVAASAIGTLENVRVEASIGSTTNQFLAGFANCSGKNSLVLKNCTFAGTVTLMQGFTSAGNYGYFGPFLGYNGGAFGGGKIENSVYEYKFTLPQTETARIKEIEFFNTKGDKTDSVKNTYTNETVDENTVYTFNCIINMNPVTIASLNGEDIMAHYGAPVIRFTLDDGSYRYLDGFDRANGRYKSSFAAEAFNKMYKYKDISYLTREKIKDASVTEGEATVSSTYSLITISTAEEFESFARIINSAIPASFKNTDGKSEQLSILDTIAISIKLDGDIVLDTDEYGNKSEFTGLGKQEFYPYRGGIDGNGYSITLNIDAPNGYCIGLIAVASEMTEAVTVKDITVKGSISGKTKVGIIGYFDMVCNAYIAGGDVKFENVVNEADVSGYTCVGGLLGAVSCANDAVKTYVDGCVNKGNITLAENGKYAGGIIGCAGFYSVSGVDVKNTVNEGNVTAMQGATEVGGIIGCISDDKSVLENVSNSGTVSAPEGKIAGNLVGRSGALKVDADEGDIGKYNVTALSNIAKITFASKEMASVYGNRYSVKLADDNVTPNYSVNLIFTDENGEKASFTDINGNVSYERKKDALGAYTVILNPGVYTVSMVLRLSEGYYNGDASADGTVLEDTAVYTVSKKGLSYSFPSVSTGYTGSAIDYFEVLKTIAGYKESDYALPDTSAATGAKWKVEYYKNGVKTEPKEFGEYEVKISIDATDTFASRYDYFTEAQVTTLKIKNLLTVKVKDIEITRGANAKFEYEIIAHDGADIGDYSALNLKVTVKGFGSPVTANLPLGTYVIEVSGSDTFGEYEVEYVSGTLVVKNATADSGSSSGGTNTGNKGCGGCGGSAGATGLTAIFCLAAFVLKRKSIKE